MNVKQAVRIAMAYVSEVFESEKPENIGLEEVVLNELEGVWEITVGFSRPWDHQKPSVMTGFQPLMPKRQFKVVAIDNETGEVRSIKMRERPNA